MKTKVKGITTHHYVEKSWNQLSEKEKEDILQMLVDSLIVTKYPGLNLQEDIKAIFSALAENNIEVPSAPFSVLDIVLFYHHKLDRSERIDRESFNTALDYYLKTLLQIVDALKAKDQTIDSLKTALKAKDAGEQHETDC